MDSNVNHVNGLLISISEYDEIKMIKIDPRQGEILDKNNLIVYEESLYFYYNYDPELAILLIKGYGIKTGGRGSGKYYRNNFKKITKAESKKMVERSIDYPITIQGQKLSKFGEMVKEDTSVQDIYLVKANLRNFIKDTYVIFEKGPYQLLNYDHEESLVWLLDVRNTLIGYTMNIASNQKYLFEKSAMYGSKLRT